tara:strand:- start:681 stop:1397 length:717 start_codon:yes stop_codon:yes gene_type:complete
MSLGLGIANELLETPISWLPNEQGLELEIAFWYQNGVNVSSAAWLDSSPRGNNATQLSIGNQPTVSEGGLDFNPTVPDFMDLDNKITIAPEQGFTLAFVIKLDALVNRVILSDGNNEFIEIMNSKKFRIKTNNPSNVTTVLASTDNIFATGTKQLITLSRTTEGNFKWTIGKDIVSVDSGASTNTTNTGGFDIHNLCVRNDNDRAVDGLLYEIVFYNRALSLSELNNLQIYLKDKFNI